MDTMFGRSGLRTSPDVARRHGNIGGGDSGVKIVYGGQFMAIGIDVSVDLQAIFDYRWFVVFPQQVIDGIVQDADGVCHPRFDAGQIWEPPVFHFTWLGTELTCTAWLCGMIIGFQLGGYSRCRP